MKYDNMVRRNRRVNEEKKERGTIINTVITEVTT